MTRPRPKTVMWRRVSSVETCSSRRWGRPHWSLAASRKPPAGGSSKKRSRSKAAAAAADEDDADDAEAAFLRRQQQQQRRRMPAGRSSGRSGGGGASGGSGLFADMLRAALEAGVAQLVDMGYSRSKALDALHECDCDVEAAVEFLTAACC